MRIALLAVPFLAACGFQPAEPEVEISDAVVRLSPVPANPAAGYFTARSNNEPTRLVSVASSKAGRIELHGTTSQGGMMSMRALQPGETTFEDGALTFAPGAKHLMLFDVAADVRPGTRIPLTFRFEPAMNVTVEAEVRAAGDMGHMGH